MSTYTVGEMIALQVNYQESDIVGRVFAYDEDASTVILQVESPETVGKVGFKVISTSAIKSTSAVKGSYDHFALVELPSFDAKKASEREQAALLKARRAAQQIGVGVTKEGQQIFNNIANIYNRTAWDGKQIVVMGEIVISPPYQADHVSTRQSNGGNDKLVTLVKQILVKYHSK
eukprot:TRINITY_DN5_c0_g1_i2.p2 TRINITY_DN5_c0_g1~~TRINITY_DN5_c0_g1_i2.p2  ORF type:complete len:175 (-),score=41.33 TRINITY_DN5_c0_g1_i2:25-549(-)